MDLLLGWSIRERLCPKPAHRHRHHYHTLALSMLSLALLVVDSECQTNTPDQSPPLEPPLVAQYTLGDQVLLGLSNVWAYNMSEYSPAYVNPEAMFHSMALSGNDLLVGGFVSQAGSQDLPGLMGQIKMEDNNETTMTFVRSCCNEEDTGPTFSHTSIVGVSWGSGDDYYITGFTAYYHNATAMQNADYSLLSSWVELRDSVHGMERLPVYLFSHPSVVARGMTSGTTEFYVAVVGDAYNCSSPNCLSNADGFIAEYTIEEEQLEDTVPSLYTTVYNHDRPSVTVVRQLVGERCVLFVGGVARRIEVRSNSSEDLDGLVFAKPCGGPARDWELLYVTVNDLDGDEHNDEDTRVTCLALSSEGVIAAGQTHGFLVNASTIANPQGNITGSGLSAFVSAVDREGILQWTRQLGHQGSRTQAIDVAVETSTNKIIVAGITNGDLGGSLSNSWCRSNQSHSENECRPPGFWESYIAIFANNGSLLSVHQFGGDGSSNSSIQVAGVELANTTASGSTIVIGGGYLGTITSDQPSSIRMMPFIATTMHVSTDSPTMMPTDSPSSGPSLAPTGGPSLAPTGGPSLAPTGGPSLAPTGGPSLAPTGGPTTVQYISTVGSSTSTGPEISSKEGFVLLENHTGVVGGWPFFEIKYSRLDSLPAASCEDDEDVQHVRLRKPGCYVDHVRRRAALIYCSISGLSMTEWYFPNQSSLLTCALGTQHDIDRFDDSMCDACTTCNQSNNFVHHTLSTCELPRGIRNTNLFKLSRMLYFPDRQCANDSWIESKYIKTIGCTYSGTDTMQNVYSSIYSCSTDDAPLLEGYFDDTCRNFSALGAYEISSPANYGSCMEAGADLNFRIQCAPDNGNLLDDINGRYSPVPMNSTVASISTWITILPSTTVGLAVNTNDSPDSSFPVTVVVSVVVAVVIVAVVILVVKSYKKKNESTIQETHLNDASTVDLVENPLFKPRTSEPERSKATPSDVSGSENKYSVFLSVSNQSVIDGPNQLEHRYEYGDSHITAPVYSIPMEGASNYEEPDPAQPAVYDQSTYMAPSVNQMVAYDASGGTYSAVDYESVK